MTVLTREVLLDEIAARRIVVEPLEPGQVGPASIDLTLGDEIRVFESNSAPIPIRDDVDYRAFTRVAALDEPYVLAPGETIHGITRERVTLAQDLCGLLEGRSRFARLGLMIHVTSALVQPGVSNRQVLEISNVSGRPLEIHAGVRICQLVVMRAEGRAQYRGRFAQQEGL
jgi:dCTP deaminase